MANIWKQNREVTNKVKRNNHDLSFDNHATFKLGYLYPVFCKFTVPGDSFRIRSAFDLKLMPLVFPLQSKLRANLHFFYVRAKNCWPEIEDYLTGISRSTPLVEPYLAPDDSKVTTGSIYDFLGVPTTAVTSGSSVTVKSLIRHGAFPCMFKAAGTSLTTKITDFAKNPTSSNDFILPIELNDVNLITSPIALNSFTAAAFTPNNFQNPVAAIYSGDDITTCEMKAVVSVGVAYTADDTITFTDTALEHLLNYYNTYRNNVMYLVIASSGAGWSAPSPLPLDTPDEDVFVTVSKTIPAGFSEYKDLHLGLYKDKLHLKALPFRAYESCYRAYYANDILQPLVDSNGDSQYNKYCSTQAGGLDTTDYHLFKRNYELDFLTSAYPSPQAGPAPLVGMSALGNITIEDENGITTAKAEVDSDGHITGVSITSPLASVEHGRTLVNLANVGMSINDFRNANALQKFLEQTLRSGYRYIDFIKGQWGVKPKDQALDMPEFIGGFSREVSIQTITSLADTGSSSLSSTLGGFGANGRVLGGSDFAVSKFCDDYGYIIGIMCVTPTPAYSQLLNKQMIAGDNYLSFPFPQFNQLGMQPIPYKEVAPIQSYIDFLSDPSKSLEDCFGYQRPNYDLVGSVDEVHGEFRGSLRNYLINRIFDGRPELGSSFIEIDPSEVNDVFVNQNPDDDVLIGHLRFKVDTKRPFPRIHFPSL